MRRLAFVVLSLFLCGLAAPPRASAQPPEGDWAGTLKLGDEPDRVIVHFRVEGGEVKGSLDFPLRERMNLDLSGVSLDGDRLRFQWQGERAVNAFDGRLGGGTISGGVRRGEARGTLELVRLAKVDPRVYDQYSGLYEVGPGRLISVARLGPGPVFTDFETGRTGALLPLSPDTLFAGPAFLLPAPVDVKITFLRSPAGEVTGLVFAEAGRPEKRARRVRFRREEVTFRNGDVTLSGTLVLPNTKGPHPAVVRIQGAGPESRANNADEFTAYRGIAFLAYDKRGVGKSTGDWRTSSFEDLAEDALAGVRLLKGRPDIDPRKIGVTGGSEGGWVAAAAASRSRDLAFVVMVAGPAVSYVDEVMLEAEGDLRLRGGFSGKELADALAFQRLVLDAARSGAALTDEGWAGLEAAAQKVRGERWYRYVEPDPRDSYWWRRAPLIANFDPTPIWEKTKIPVLALYAELDRNAPAAGNAAALERALKKAGNRDYTIKVLPRANHGFLEVENGQGFLRESPRLRRYVPGFFGAVNEWVLRRFSRRR